MDGCASGKLSSSGLRGSRRGVLVCTNSEGERFRARYSETVRGRTHTSTPVTAEKGAGERRCDPARGVHIPA